jgi:hypothetical protein
MLLYVVQEAARNSEDPVPFALHSSTSVEAAAAHS